MRVDNVQTVYPTKRDAWLVAVLWALSSCCSSPSLPVEHLRTVGVSRRDDVLLGGSALILWITYGTQYILTARELLVHSGPSLAHFSTRSQSLSYSSPLSVACSWTSVFQYGQQREIFSSHARQGSIPWRVDRTRAGLSRRQRERSGFHNRLLMHGSS